MIESFLLATYLTLLLCLALYSLHAYTILYYYLRFPKKKKRENSPPLVDYPFVTIQLPIYNEKYVVKRLLASIANLDYPKERYEIQILDDSTDETTFLLSSLVEKYSSLGYNIHLYHRPQRNGFKAGALREGLAKAKGTYIAIFDADFIVPPDFLKRVLPYFTTEKIGAVQTRWGHLNRNYSILTQGQALALDAHFLFEQDIKATEGLFINFNGTGGVWRKEAIESAGGWQDDTLTEDLDLSYRAQMEGYKIIFLPDLVCPGELPIDVSGFKKQQFRWTKGGIEVARKLLGKVLCSSLPWRVKFFSFTHLTCPFVYPILLSLSLLSLPILNIKITYTQLLTNSLLSPLGEVSIYSLTQSKVIGLYFLLLTLFTVFVLPFPITYILSYFRVHQLEKKKVEGWGWIFVAFLLIGGFASLSISNTWAIVQAIFGKKTEFARTPKFSIVGKEGGLHQKKYIYPFSPSAFFELGMGLYLLLTLIYSLLHLEFGLIPFLLLYALGYLFLSVSTIYQHWRFKVKPKIAEGKTAPEATGETS